MAISPLLNVEVMRKFQDELILDAMTYGFSMTRIEPKKMTEPVFRWYVGHDPYNSADNEVLMRHIARAGNRR